MDQAQVNRVNPCDGVDAPKPVMVIRLKQLDLV